VQVRAWSKTLGLSLAVLAQREPAIDRLRALGEERFRARPVRIRSCAPPAQQHARERGDLGLHVLAVVENHTAPWLGCAQALFRADAFGRTASAVRILPEAAHAGHGDEPAVVETTLVRRRGRFVRVARPSAATSRPKPALRRQASDLPVPKRTIPKACPSDG
jgi:hypothetical protein